MKKLEDSRMSNIHISGGLMVKAVASVLCGVFGLGFVPKPHFSAGGLGLVTRHILQTNELKQLALGQSHKSICA